MTSVEVIYEPAPGELVAAVHDRFVARDDLRGFGGMHGGFVLAQATAAMAADTPALELRGVTGRFLRPVRSDARWRLTLTRTRVRDHEHRPRSH